jgi:hypothetical protein
MTFTLDQECDGRLCGTFELGFDSFEHDEHVTRRGFVSVEMSSIEVFAKDFSVPGAGKSIVQADLCSNSEVGEIVATKRASGF